uniref:Transmembrane protein n=1 Tax=Trichuris muris TaxID=70415 RepID=A0A5S6QLT5_TRIMR
MPLLYNVKPRREMRVSLQMQQVRYYYNIVVLTSSLFVRAIFVIVAIFPSLVLAVLIDSVPLLRFLRTSVGLFVLRWQGAAKMSTHCVR